MGWGNLRLVLRLLLAGGLGVGRVGLIALLGLHARVDLLERGVLASLAVLERAHEHTHELEHSQLTQQRHVERPTRTAQHRTAIVAAFLSSTVLYLYCTTTILPAGVGVGVRAEREAAEFAQIGERRGRDGLEHGPLLVVERVLQEAHQSAHRHAVLTCSATYSIIIHSRWYLLFVRM